MTALVDLQDGAVLGFWGAWLKTSRDKWRLCGRFFLANMSVTRQMGAKRPGKLAFPDTIADGEHLYARPD